MSNNTVISGGRGEPESNPYNIRPEVDIKADKTSWVYKIVTPFNQVSFSPGQSIILDLSEYLPKDNATYEISGWINSSTGTSIGNSVKATLGGFRICEAVTAAARRATCAGQFIIPIDGNRKVILENIETTVGTSLVSLHINYYKRIEKTK